MLFNGSRKSSTCPSAGVKGCVEIRRRTGNGPLYLQESRGRFPQPVSFHAIYPRWQSQIFGWVYIAALIYSNIQRSTVLSPSNLVNTSWRVRLTMCIQRPMHVPYLPPDLSDNLEGIPPWWKIPEWSGIVSSRNHVGYTGNHYFRWQYFVLVFKSKRNQNSHSAIFRGTFFDFDFVLIKIQLDTFLSLFFIFESIYRLINSKLRSLVES